MLRYLRGAIRTHPFNFLTLLIAVIAAGFAGLSAYEAHQTRIEADAASKAQAKDVERARKAAEKSAEAAEHNASSAESSARAAQTTAEDVKAINRLRLDPQINVECDSYNDLLIVRNVGNVDAIQLTIGISHVTLGTYQGKSMVAAMSQGSNWKWSLPEFAANSVHQFKVNNAIFPVWDPKWELHPETKPLILMEASYLRNPDRLSYRGHAVFMPDKTGLKVPDSDDVFAHRDVLESLGRLIRDGDNAYYFHRQAVQIDWSGYK